MYLIFDTETTGLPKNYDAPLSDADNWPRLVQIAWQLHDNTGKLINAKNLIVKPNGFVIPFNTVMIHGVTTEIALAEGKDLAEVLAEFTADLEKNLLAVAHNAPFDLSVIGAEYLRLGQENHLEKVKIYDTQKETTDFVAIPSGKTGTRFKFPKLSELYFKLFNENFEDAHDAAYDVKATARAFFGLITQKIISPSDDTAVENIIYEPPILDESNFAKRKLINKKERKVRTKKIEGETLPFVHLHVHSEFSILQSTAKIKGILKKAQEKNMSAVAFTDLGNLHGAFNATNYAPEFGVKAIIGAELYVAKERKRLQFTKNEKDERFQVVLLAKNKAGYQNLSKIVSLGYVEGLYSGFPRVDKELIKQYKENLICISGSLSGEISRLILNEGEEKAEKALQWWLDTFEDDFYLELIRHGLEAEDYVNNVLLDFADKYNIKVIATNDIYFLEKKEKEAHDILLAVKDGEKMSTPVGYGRGKRYSLPNDQYYFKSIDEMNVLFEDIPEALTNTIEIADKCESYNLKEKTNMPRFEMPKEFETQDDYLRHLTYEGAKTRYGNPVPDDVAQRLDFELNTIKNMGFPGYFLIVQDFINEGKKMGVVVGPGRGSAAGSAVAYCVGITNIDPILYNLLFERFLNPERVSMPDIDIDFDDERRGDVINYVIKKYGRNQVAQIITYGTMAAKMVIKDVARVMELDLSISNQLAKLVPEKAGTKLKDAVLEVQDLKDILNGADSLSKKVLVNALILEGSVRNTGIHAAGVIIAPDDILTCVPVCTAKDADLFVTQFDGKVIEEAGMLKMDFLGLKTLTVIRDCLKLIELRTKEVIDIDKISFQDEKTYQLYQNGDTNGTFQFESEGMQMYLRQLKPTNIEDLIAMNSLYRPGPIAFIPLYIERKHGREAVEYAHPLLEKILKDTFGIMVYQEQIMQTAQLLAGYSLGGADLLRRAMGKKKKEEMDKQRDIFVKGSKEKNDIPAEKANEIFDIMQKFAEYGFNRSHSAAYSVVAYQTAYLKANYPAEYMAAVLTHNMTIEKVTFFLDECNKMGISVLGPDANESNAEFTVNQEGKIRFGLAAIKGTGDAAIESIMEERKQGKFKDVFDFAARNNSRTVNKKSFESMAQAGAFDSFGIDRAAYFAEGNDKSPFIEKLIKYGNALIKDKENSKSSLFGGKAEMKVSTPPIPTDFQNWTKIEKLNKEKEVVGFFISGHPLDEYKAVMNRYKAIATTQLENYDKQEVYICGTIGNKNIKVTQKGTSFTTFFIEDYQGNLEMALFGQDHDKFSDQIEVGETVMLKGKVQKGYRGDKFELKLIEIKNLSQLKLQSASGVKISVPLQEVTPIFMKELTNLLTAFAGDMFVKMEFYDLNNPQIRTIATSNKYKVNANDYNLIAKLEYLKVDCEVV